eukprot:GGOE01032352.1.p1 GENE.GGOE01032352.1~~GGOE01032352.1.p1  ORF type:complete len:860 (-),score=216.86 GGOE01032352.1:1321-3900(-)
MPDRLKHVAPDQLDTDDLLSPVSSRLDISSCRSWQGRPTRLQPSPSPRGDSLASPTSCSKWVSSPRRASGCISDYSRQGSQVFLCPVLEVEAESPLEVSLTHKSLNVPSWWVCAIPEGTAVAGPLAVLAAAAGCWFAVSGLTTTNWYAALYAALSLAMLLLMFLHFALNTQRLLRRMGHNLAAALAAEHGHVADRMAVDRRILFLQNALRTDRAEAVVPRDPLDFLQAELKALPTGPEGYIIINTTGIILWVNAALLFYFGYTAEELLHQNVRVLMPKPYSVQHDYFLRKHVETGKCCVLGKSREVPVLDKSGMQSLVMMGLDDRIDPRDAHNRIFLARMEFNTEDALLQNARLTLASSAPVQEALKVLEGVTEAVVATNAQGIVLFANRAAHDLFQWPEEDLVGENVSVLMAEPFASAHDGFIKAYQTRAENAQHQGASWPVSRIVGSGRDVMAMAKSGQPVRVFLMVARMDRPSGRPQQCLFVAKMVHITGEEDDSSSVLAIAKPGGCSGGKTTSFRTASSPCTARTTVTSINQHAADRDVVVRRFLSRRCTVVGVAVGGLGGAGDPEALHRDFSTVLGLVTAHCSQHRGSPHWVIGMQLFVVFNLASLPNMCHRSSASAFMLQLSQAFANSTLAQRSTLQLAAVSWDGLCGQWGSHHLLTGNPLHCVGILLSAQRESRVSNPVIDGLLYEELQYNYMCRPVNRAMFSDNGSVPGVLEVYELLALREVSGDEWMYKLPDADEPQAHWSLAWTQLSLAMETALLSPKPQPSESALGGVCHLLQQHLDDNPADATAKWLLELLKQWNMQAAPTVCQRQCGSLTYRLQFDSVEGFKSVTTSFALPVPRSCWTDSEGSNRG